MLRLYTQKRKINMKKPLLLLFFLPFVIFAQPKEPIYHSQKIFTYAVEMVKTTGGKENRKIHLTTFNETWPFDDRQKYIGWEENIKHVNNKSTGVLESAETIFLHPPRMKDYAILEFSPFPLVHFPLSVGQEWTWSLDIGTYWAKQAGIKNFEGLQTFTHLYRVAAKTAFWYNNKTFDCFVIEANCKSKFGESQLVAYFNDELGFVKLKYRNMDGSHFTFFLVNVIDGGMRKNFPLFLQSNP
jgi:hypothetical protein